MSEKPPRHAYELTLRIGGETWEDVLRMLENKAHHIRQHGPECDSTWGGAGTSGYVHIQTRDVTPEKYREELEAWMQRRREGEA